MLPKPFAKSSGSLPAITTPSSRLPLMRLPAPACTAYHLASADGVHRCTGADLHSVVVGKGPRPGSVGADKVAFDGVEHRGRAFDVNAIVRVCRDDISQQAAVSNVDRAIRRQIVLTPIVLDSAPFAIKTPVALLRAKVPE